MAIDTVKPTGLVAVIGFLSQSLLTSDLPHPASCSLPREQKQLVEAALLQQEALPASCLQGHLWQTIEGEKSGFFQMPSF